MHRSTHPSGRRHRPLRRPHRHGSLASRSSPSTALRRRPTPGASPQSYRSWHGRCCTRGVVFDRARQPIGSSRAIAGTALRIATLVTTVVTGCARAHGELLEDAGLDAAMIDARSLDAASPDAAPDAAVLPDAPAPDAGCAISPGLTPAIDG